MGGFLIAVIAAAVLATGATASQAGFHNPGYVAAHIQRSLNKQMILSNVSGKARCAGSTRVIACLADSRTEGVLAHQSWRYTYISSQRAKLVTRVEDMDGTVLGKQTYFVRPQRYGLRSF